MSVCPVFVGGGCLSPAGLSLSVPQGTREEDDVVSEDLVEQDAKVRLVGGWDGWHLGRDGRVALGPCRPRAAKGGWVSRAPMLGQSPT